MPMTTCLGRMGTAARTVLVSERGGIAALICNYERRAIKSSLFTSRPTSPCRRRGGYCRSIHSAMTNELNPKRLRAGPDLPWPMALLQRILDVDWHVPSCVSFY